MENEMKILIACDMEGISGVVSWNQVDPSHPEYQRFRHIMTADVNAAVAGAFAGGATEVAITDGHWNSGNVLIEELDERAFLNTGSPSPLSMVQGVGEGVDAVIFLGYHARAGTQNAMLDHTWSSIRVSNLWINGRLTGEFGLNGAVCGSFGVPVIMVSGDQSVCAEAREWVPGVLTAQVKKSTGRMSARCLPLKSSQVLIRDTAEKAVKSAVSGSQPAPLKVATPVTMTVEFFNTLMGDSASLLPGAKRLDGRKIEFTAESMPLAYTGFRAAVNLISV
jgi:D-amino peptidase